MNLDRRTSVGWLVAMLALSPWGPAAAGPKSATAQRVHVQLEKSKEAIKAGKYRQADAFVKTAARLAKGDWTAANRVVARQAAVHAYRRQFDKAARVIIDRLPEAAKRRDERWEFWFHNILMMLRAAQSDVSGALLECYELKTVGDAGTWTHPDRPRKTQVDLKDSWHRALYLRLRAEQVKGSQKKALVSYAQRARAAYKRLAKTQKGFDDSIAVLDAIFAVHAKNKRAALAAARRVDIEKNGDVEDLYLVFAGLLYGGDLKAARRVYEKMKSVSYVSHANAIMLMWVQRDLAAAKGKKARWTPLHVHGRR